MAFVQPCVDGAADIFELAGEKVFGAVNDYEAFGFRKRREERLDIRARAELIIAALDDEFWFRAIAQESKVRVIHGNSQTDQVRDALVHATHAQSHQRAKAEPREQNRPLRKFRRKIIECGAHVVLFADAAIVRSFALARAAEIETQDRDAAKMQRFCRLIDDFVVHRAAEARVRVTHHGDQRWIRSGDGPQQCLQPSGGAGEKKIAMECFSHEIASARV